MKIMVVHGRYRSVAPSGENQVVDQESAALEALGHEVLHVERHSDDIGGWSLRDKALLPARTVYNRPVRDALRTSLERERPDVVHVHNTFPLLSPSVLDACADAGVPVVATLHNYKLLCASGDFFRAGSPCHDCADTRTGPALAHGCYRGSRVATLPVVAGLRANRARWREQVSAYVFISAAQRDLMGALDLPADRVFVKHNFVPEPLVPEPLASEPLASEPLASSAPKEHLVTYVGRLDEAKGVGFLMQAWDAFRTTRPTSRLRLRVVGGGPLEDDVRRWAGARPEVEVRGLVPRGEAADLLAGSLAALVPSQWEETFGLVAVEAMAVGTAPLVPDRGSFPELVGAGPGRAAAGRQYAAGEVAALAEVLAEVDDQPDRFVALGGIARAAYLARHRAPDNLARLLEIYAYAIGHPVARTAGGELRVG